MKGCLLAVGVLVVALAGYVSYSRYYVPWRHLAPYRALVERRATEDEAVRTPHYNHGIQSGTPDDILTDPDALRQLAKSLQISSPASKVFIYWADPWNDGDGYRVYLFFDKGGRAMAAELAPWLLDKTATEKLPREEN